jgi:hypothetical protein
MAKLLTDTLSLSDARNAGISKLLSEGLTLADVLATAGAHYATLTETLSLVDARSVAMIVHALTETLPLSDTRSGNLNKALNEILSLTDTRSAGMAKLVTEYLQFIDSQNMPLNNTSAGAYLEALADRMNNRIQ